MTDSAGRPALSNAVLNQILDEVSAGLPVSLHISLDRKLTAAQVAAVAILVASTPGVTKVGAVALVPRETRARLMALKSAKTG